MVFSSMRYKDYIWPHNPESFSINCQREIAVRKIPFGRYCTQDLGLGCRVMRGEGDFVGSGAYDEFCRLAAVFCLEGPGTLTHPILGAVSAHFVSLQLEEKPLPDYVRYSFEFRESSESNMGLTEVSTAAAVTATAAGGTASSRYHTVKKGDTLWGIANTYSVTLTSVIAANPQIKNPNLIYPGDRVRVR